MSDPGTQATPSNPTGQGPFGGNPFVNLATLVTGVQDVVKAVYTLEQQIEQLLTILGTSNTDLSSIATNTGNVATNTSNIDTALATINTTLSTVFPLRTLQGSKTFDPPSIADKASSSTTVTVTGASLGNYAVASFSLDTAGLSLTATVTAANTVTVVFSNLTGGAVDLASGLLSVRTFS